MGLITKAKDILQAKVPFDAPLRSPKWKRVRNDYLLKNSTCAVCGGKISLNVHHIKPYHKFPELELDCNNLITLCESGNRGLNCHLLIGHLGNFRKINSNVVEDAKLWKQKLK